MNALQRGCNLISTPLLPTFHKAYTAAPRTISLIWPQSITTKKLRESMINHRNRTGAKKPRVTLGDRDIKNLLDLNGSDSVAALAKRTGLPYMLVYNVVHRRVLSVSHRHYQMLFGRPAPLQDTLKVDGTRFRAMADLWLFLNEGLTRADLYRDLFDLGHKQKVDHRIFNGKISTIDMRLEHTIREKFHETGVDNELLTQWLDEFEQLPRNDMISYTRIRPVLAYLKDELGLHPTSVLNQSVARYESGTLQRVSRKIADRAEALKQKTEKARQEDGQQGKDKIKESIVGPKPGYTLYTDIKEELLFLCAHTKRSVKHYLGRSIWTYENRKAKRVANWRARQILQDCDRFIRQSPNIPLASLPPSRQRVQTQRLNDVLVARTTQLLSEKDGIDFEKGILTPSHTRQEYNNPHHGFTPFDMASQVLGMKRRAFDLMVARHCEIFRSVGKFAQRWYLPDLYLRELSRKKEFSLISVRYELLAKEHRRPRPINACMN